MAAVVCGTTEVGLPRWAAICQQRQGKTKRRFDHFVDTNLCETWQVSLYRLVSQRTPPRSGLPGCDGQDRLWGEDLATPSFTRGCSAGSFPFGAATALRRHRPVERSYSSRLTPPFTGPRRTTFHFKTARTAAPCATACSAALAPRASIFSADPETSCRNRANDGWKIEHERPCGPRRCPPPPLSSRGKLPVIV